MSISPKAPPPAALNSESASHTNRLRLIDPHGRHIHKLRVQLTDACNYRCFYCMPENVRFSAAKDLLTAKEISDIVSALVHHGIDEVRLTGGEPTLRRDFEDIVRGLSDLPLEKFGLTSNGYTLEAKLPFLQTTNCRNLNISLDSLNPEKFFEITKRDSFDSVLSAIQKAAAMGFQVKVNTVLFRGINDHEVMDFVRFSASHQVEVRFLEYMKIGPSQNQFEQYFISKQEITDHIGKHDPLELLSSPVDSTAVRYRTASGARLGFIASESESFCASCSRLRLTAKGKLRSCLMSEDGLDLRHQPVTEYPSILQKVMTMKPFERIESIDEPMHQIGG
jgi:cyclic pyranopterin phosphate synthase